MDPLNLDGNQSQKTTLEIQKQKIGQNLFHYHFHDVMTIPHIRKDMESDFSLRPEGNWHKTEYYLSPG